jgi:hypothetical protein
MVFDNDDPATGWFEITEIPTKQANFIAKLLKFNWLTCYPWPTNGGAFLMMMWNIRNVKPC